MRLLQEVGLSNQVETVNTRFQAGRDGGRTL
jgi:ribosomal protein S28E/S33